MRSTVEVVVVCGVTASLVPKVDQKKGVPNVRCMGKYLFFVMLGCNKNILTAKISRSTVLFNVLVLTLFSASEACCSHTLYTY